MTPEKIVHNFFSKYSEASAKIRILDYGICLKYSYVEVEGPKGRALGVSYVPIEDLSPNLVADPPEMGRLEEGLSSLNPLNRSLFLSLLNASCQYYMWKEGKAPGKRISGNLIEILHEILPKGAKVGVVGNIGPIVRKIKDLGLEALVLERNPSLRTEGVYPDVFAKRILPSCDAIVVTGTVLLNDTVEEILEAARNAEVKVIVGPTAQIDPEILPGFDYYASVEVLDICGAKDILKRGGWAFNETSRYYIIRM